MGVLSHLPAGSGSFYPYQIDQSCRFNDDDSASLSITPGSATNRTTWTFSTWLKRGNISVEQHIFEGSGGANEQFYISGSDTLVYYLDGTSYILTTPIFRDVSSWYHLILKWDTTNGTASDRCMIYINGVRISAASNPALNTASYINFNTTHYIGRYNGAAVAFLDGYLAETNFVDGLALDADSFGETKSGVWVPKRYTGAYGSNGFHLDYSNSSHFGEDQSGNGNDFTDSGLATNDQVEDSPTNNWCTMNSTVPQSIGGTMSNGNLVCTTTVGSVEALVSTMPLIAGKGYCEVTITDVGVGTLIGIISADADFDGTQNVYTDANSVSYYSNNGALYAGGGLEDAGYGDAYTTSDIIGIAVDVSGQTITFYKNNATQGSVDISGWDKGAGWIFGIGDASGGGTATVTSWNFGQLGFTYTPPAGFKAINSSNMSSVNSLYLEGNKGFDTAVYTGTGAEKAITSLEFSPDLVWIKNRDAVDEHVLTDAVRGATKEINSNSTNVESTVVQGVKSFDSAGFTLGTQAEYNTNGENYVAWNWKEDPNYGFDIASYSTSGSAQTVNHNLGVVPELIFVKSRSSVTSWYVYCKDLNGGVTPEDYYMLLNSSNGEANAGTVWNSTAPTSSVFSIGNNSDLVGAGKTHVAYLFASIEGYSKVFSYMGNGDADGPFIYCGFRPRFILIKKSTGVDNWFLHDTERAPQYNVDGTILYSNLPAVDTYHQEYELDFLSNGFKIRASGGGSHNENTSTYIGMAFAETPFKYANAR